MRGVAVAVAGAGWWSCFCRNGRTVKRRRNHHHHGGDPGDVESAIVKVLTSANPGLDWE